MKQRPLVTLKYFLSLFSTPNVLFSQSLSDTLLEVCYKQFKVCPKKLGHLRYKKLVLTNLLLRKVQMKNFIFDIVFKTELIHIFGEEIELYR